MKLPLLLILSAAVLFCSFDVSAQRRRPIRVPAVKAPEIGKTAVVIDESLSVLRAKPSLFAEPVQRMRRGRKVQILGSADGDGVKFYRVSAPPASTGWVQADAVFGKFRAGDQERLAKLVQASAGFDRVELASAFFDLYPASPLRPSILLLFGDLIEETAGSLSRDASRRLDRREMAATAAPAHSYYLNFVSLDRYRKLGIVFLFNGVTRTYHYDGASWREIVEKFPSSAEAVEARKRLDALKIKMDRTATAK